MPDILTVVVKVVSHVWIHGDRYRIITDRIDEAVPILEQLEANRQGLS